MAEPQYRDEPIASFGSGLTSSHTWHTQALEAVDRLNGRVAMLSFLVALADGRRRGRDAEGRGEHRSWGPLPRQKTRTGVV